VGSQGDNRHESLHAKHLPDGHGRTAGAGARQPVGRRADRAGRSDNAENRAADNPATQVQTATDAQGRATSGAAGDGGEIVVTGSLFRQTDAATPSPVTTITTENLDQRGITTIQSAIQSLASNNGPALTNSFTANGAFAGGASAVSLRGLSTNSTLVLFDGLRAAYYPLADDATRNFVDLNTIPDDIVDRIEVLRDGASSSYGADAIAGVVNIITKRKFNGISGRARRASASGASPPISA